MQSVNSNPTNYTSRWDRDERRIGFTLSKLTANAKLSKLNNTERLFACLGQESAGLNGIKVAAASRWCSTVYTNLTMQQLSAVVAACRNSDNLAAFVSDPIAYFDNIAGYKHEKPVAKTHQPISTGVFANINAAV